MLLRTPGFEQPFTAAPSFHFICNCIILISPSHAFRCNNEHADLGNIECSPPELSCLLHSCKCLLTILQIPCDSTLTSRKAFCDHLDLDGDGYDDAICSLHAGNAVLLTPCHLSREVFLQSCERLPAAMQPLGMEALRFTFRHSGLSASTPRPLRRSQILDAVRQARHTTMKTTWKDWCDSRWFLGDPRRCEEFSKVIELC